MGQGLIIWISNRAKESDPFIVLIRLSLTQNFIYKMAAPTLFSHSAKVNLFDVILTVYKTSYYAATEKIAANRTRSEMKLHLLLVTNPEFI